MKKAVIIVNKPNSNYNYWPFCIVIFLSGILPDRDGKCEHQHQQQQQ